MIMFQPHRSLSQLEEDALSFSQYVYELHRGFCQLEEGESI